MMKVKVISTVNPEVLEESLNKFFAETQIKGINQMIQSSSGERVTVTIVYTPASSPPGKLDVRWP